MPGLFLRFCLKCLVCSLIETFALDLNQKFTSFLIELDCKHLSLAFFGTLFWVLARFSFTDYHRSNNNRRYALVFVVNLLHPICLLDVSPLTKHLLHFLLSEFLLSMRTYYRILQLHDPFDVGGRS